MRNTRNFDFKKIIAAAVLLAVLFICVRYYMSGEKSAPPPSPFAPPAAGTQTPGHGKNQSASPPARERAAGPHSTSPLADTAEASLTTPAPAARTAEVGSAAPPRAVSFSAAAKGVITGNGVNVRSESRVDAANANVVVKVNKGERVQVLGSEKPANDNKVWYNVKLKDGRTGFVREDLIRIE